MELDGERVRIDKKQPPSRLGSVLPNFNPQDDLAPQKLRRAPVQFPSRDRGLHNTFPSPEGPFGSLKRVISLSAPFAGTKREGSV